MKLEFLRKQEGCRRLILVFSGWSADSEIASEISIEGWDLAVAYDLSELRLDTDFLSDYRTVYLFAWSLGVFAANKILPRESITAAFAINGTLSPTDDKYGIPKEIFTGTAESLNSRNLLKFRIRMTPGRREWEKISHLFPDFDDEGIENLRHQLDVVSKDAESTSSTNRLPWIRAYVAEQDKIFPPANQIAAWEKQPEVEIAPAAGDHFLHLDNIVRAVIADPDQVSRKFRKASSSYDTHAIAQYSAAIKLTGMLAGLNPARGGSILEIGCGTGLFTREYCSILLPREATFVDITPTGPFDIASVENYFIEDAEQWIAKSDKKWDVILSASCIQWFADIPTFLHQCGERLNENGIIAISTFVPGNLEELDAFRPSPLLYPKAEDLKTWLERDFDDVTVREDEIKVEFKSTRDMLMHLKNTGVGGSAPTSKLSLSKLSSVRSLTYRPVYITARKR